MSRTGFLSNGGWYWVFVAFVSNGLGWAVFHFLPKTSEGALSAHLVVGVVAWFCLYFDERRSRRMLGTIGFAALFFSAALLLAVPAQEQLFAAYLPTWAEQTLNACMLLWAVDISRPSALSIGMELQ